jgi:hypothetical protein
VKPRLNIASGTDLRQPPWINLDIVPKWPCADRGCDVIWDGRKDPLPFPDASIEECFCGYTLLHLPPYRHQPLLSEILRVLEPGGRLEVREVDMPVVMAKWIADPFDKCAELIWGEQGTVHGSELADYDKHCHGFSRDSLVTTLVNAGFRSAACFDRRDVWYDLWAEAIR